jgi:hypothetical protein
MLRPFQSSWTVTVTWICELEAAVDRQLESAGIADYRLEGTGYKGSEEPLLHRRWESFRTRSTFSPTIQGRLKMSS